MFPLGAEKENSIYNFHIMTPRLQHGWNFLYYRKLAKDVKCPICAGGPASVCKNRYNTGVNHINLKLNNTHAVRLSHFVGQSNLLLHMSNSTVAIHTNIHTFISLSGCTMSGCIPL